MNSQQFSVNNSTVMPDLIRHPDPNAQKGDWQIAHAITPIKNKQLSTNGGFHILTSKFFISVYSCSSYEPEPFKLNFRFLFSFSHLQSLGPQTPSPNARGRGPQRRDVHRLRTQPPIRAHPKQAAHQTLYGRKVLFFVT